ATPGTRTWVTPRRCIAMRWPPRAPRRTTAAASFPCSRWPFCSLAVGVFDAVENGDTPCRITPKQINEIALARIVRVLVCDPSWSTADADADGWPLDVATISRVGVRRRPVG